MLFIYIHQDNYRVSGYLHFFIIYQNGKEKNKRVMNFHMLYLKLHGNYLVLYA